MEWTHPSIRALGVSDPESYIISKARSMVYKALEEGWMGPPFDPIALAEIHDVQTVPSADVMDARIISAGQHLRIEFNPDRPPARIRFSICHEIAHSLFPDCADAARHRHQGSRDDWQLETLCNRAAAEFLLPIGSLEAHIKGPISIEDVVALRREYSASSEAVLLRLVRLTTEPLLVFAAKHDAQSGRYFLEYCVASNALKTALPPGTELPSGTTAEDCNAIGYMTRGTEVWQGIGSVGVECFGVPGIPGDVFPRVVGIAKPLVGSEKAAKSIRFVRGDATSPVGRQRKVILQLVNDQATTWGRGFPVAVRARWPKAQSEFTACINADRNALALGSIVVSRLDDDTELISLVAQRGYGRSPKPRIRYGALGEALSKAAEYATRQKATVHMPRIGTGESGGYWAVVEDLIRETVLPRGLDVTVYDLPVKRQAERKVN